MDGKRQLLICLTATFTLVAFGMSGCKPDYPNCNKDKHCQDSEKGQQEGKLYCVNGLCQQCRSDDDCGGTCMECNAGACEKIAGCCTSDSDCRGSRVCRDNRCGPECKSDDDCESGEVCKGGTCEAESECSSDADCESGEECQDGECVQATTSTETSCSLKTVYFAFDSSNLSSEARDKLESNADCIKERGDSVKLAGHCDERGNNEYNLALGERRASSAKDYLESLGVSSRKISTISYGEERLARQCGIDGPESCHQENRRVEFNWQ